MNTWTRTFTGSQHTLCSARMPPHTTIWLRHSASPSQYIWQTSSRKKTYKWTGSPQNCHGDSGTLIWKFTENNVISKVTTLDAGLYPSRAKRFYCKMPTSALQPNYSLGTMVLSQGVNWSQHVGGRSPPSSTELKNEYSYTCTLPVDL